MEINNELRKILIISPHFPPSNLVSVHRARYWGTYLQDFGWQPIILTVQEKFYEEKLDYNLAKLLPHNLRIEKVKATKISKPRLFGDIGIRSWIQMYRRALNLIRNEKIDFVLITIPSFYTALLGRRLHEVTGVKYGIDYQDPWVHEFPGSNKLFSRHWFATKLSGLLEPYAVKKVKLITGVANAYFKDVIKRNPFLKYNCKFEEIPFGTDPADHDKIKTLDIPPYLFNENNKLKLVYAGTLLPKAFIPLEMVMRAIKDNEADFSNVEIYFIGSGKHPNDVLGYNVKLLAEKYNIWETIIFETPQRIPFLDVLKHLDKADGIFILGSTESHYTPSKIFQGIASKKPLFAILHEQSTGVKFIEETGAGVVLSFGGEEYVDKIYHSFIPLFNNYLELVAGFNPDRINLYELEKYFAKSLTGKLSKKLDEIVPLNTDVSKKILIISPHFPPSNLTSVHRARYFATHLPKFGWNPIVLTIHEDFYEEKLDWSLEKLIPSTLRVEKVKAAKVRKPRFIGDIGLRAFNKITERAKEIIIEENIDFLYITIPSFYGALWGRRLHEISGIKYGIDYIDPWVHNFPGSSTFFSRAWFATKLSGFLEPIAVKKASMISGVAKSYYEDVFIRNPKINANCKAVTLPPAAEINDFEILKELKIEPNLFSKNLHKIQFVYAGAMLPKAYGILEKLFEQIHQHPSSFEDLQFHFIGTGKTPNDPSGYNIKPYAEAYNLWNKQIFEYPARIPYLDVLVHLNASQAVFILGSTEAHYTPSKVYQAVLSGKPILAILHEQSTAVEVLRNSGAGFVISFNNEEELDNKLNRFPELMQEFRAFAEIFDPAAINRKDFEQYSAANITGMLAKVLDEIVAH